jgi:hypothetical protein
MASSMSGFGRGDAMAQTFSEGFGQGEPVPWEFGRNGNQRNQHLTARV